MLNEGTMENINTNKVDSKKKPGRFKHMPQA